MAEKIKIKEVIGEAEYLQFESSIDGKKLTLKEGLEKSSKELKIICMKISQEKNIYEKSWNEMIKSLKERKEKLDTEAVEQEKKNFLEKV